MGVGVMLTELLSVLVGRAVGEVGRLRVRVRVFRRVVVSSSSSSSSPPPFFVEVGRGFLVVVRVVRTVCVCFRAASAAALLLLRGARSGCDGC